MTAEHLNNNTVGPIGFGQVPKADTQGLHSQHCRGLSRWEEAAGGEWGMTFELPKKDKNTSQSLFLIGLHLGALQRIQDFHDLLLDHLRSVAGIRY